MTSCRWCGLPIEQHPHGWWVDLDGFVNCGRYRRHWPREEDRPDAPSLR